MQRPAFLACFATGLLILLPACSNGVNSEALERSFSADPQLQDGVTPSPTSNGAIASLPANFPAEIPVYPNATVQEVSQPQSSTAQGPAIAASPSAAPANQVRWSSPAPVNFVQAFYQRELQANNWQIVSQVVDDLPSTFVARRNGLEINVTIQRASNLTATASPTPSASTPSTSTPSPTAAQSANTEFTIQYTNGSSTASSTPTNNSSSSQPQPSDPNFVGPTLPANLATQSGNAQSGNGTAANLATGPQEFTDLDKAPSELRSYIKDLAELGVLPLKATNDKSTASSSTTFDPSKTITRREYARWLFTANNRLYTNRPGQQIRLAAEGAKPAFQDVSRTDPDFAMIQGLAEAGILPSPLSGDAATVTFRPDAPLTRETLVLWKVPLDTRQALPTATLDAVKQTWGFQDATKIEPQALRAVLADFQNSDLANIRRAFGYTTLFQPKKPVTRAEAAATLWYFGSQGEGISALELLQTQPSSTASPRPTGP